jgi:hypothetical protein
MLAEIVWVPMGLRMNIESGKDAKMVKHSSAEVIGLFCECLQAENLLFMKIGLFSAGSGCQTQPRPNLW